MPRLHRCFSLTIDAAIAAAALPEGAVAALLRRPDEGAMLATSRVDPAHLHVNKVVGRGTFGVVCSVTDARSGERFAVKKVAREDVREGGAKVCEQKGVNRRCGYRGVIL